MTEEIIVDGVDVAGCGAYKDKHCKDKTSIMFCDTNLCSNYPYCYYKQLKRLEQENKNFEILAKSLYKRIEELEKENEALAFRERLYKADYEASEQENKELKKIKEQLKKWNDENLKRQDDMQLWIDLAEEQRRKYRSALEEINLILDELKQQYDYMTDYSEIKEIQDKINEILQ